MASMQLRIVSLLIGFCLVATPLAAQHVRVNGQTTFAAPVGAPAGTAAAPSYAFASDPDTGVFNPFANYLGITTGAVHVANVNSVGLEVDTTKSIGWSNVAAGNSPVTSLFSDASDTLALRRGTNPQNFRVYRTFTDASNGEWLQLEGNYAGAGFGIIAKGNGTGATGSPFYFGTDTNQGLSIRTNNSEAISVQAGGYLTWRSFVFTNLGTFPNGSMMYCSDCTFANPCASGGTGAWAKRINGAWRCD